MNSARAQTRAHERAVFSHHEKLVMALPRGRIARQAGAILRDSGIFPETEFFDSDSRRLLFSANDGAFDLLTVRAFDVATYVAGGSAHLGIVGQDVLMEFDYDDLYTPIDLDIGHCRMVLAGLEPNRDRLHHTPRVRVATKYPNIAKRWFAHQAIQAESIKLHGAVELAPRLGLCHYIVDLVSTGQTLKANGLFEVAPIADISSRLIVNRMAWKTRKKDILPWIEKFESRCHGLKT